MTFELPTQTFKRLQDILEREIRLYKRMDLLLDDKREAIIYGDLNRLANVDGQLETLHQMAKESIQERLELLQSVGAGNQRLEEFAYQLQPAMEKPLLEIRHRLKRTVDDLNKKNQHNMDLLERSIHWITQSVQMLASLLMPAVASYGPPGKSESGSYQAISIHSTIQHQA